MNVSAFEEYRLGNGGLREWASGLLASILRDRRITTKEAARDLECAPRTLENLLAARNAPSLELLREMARQFPEARPAIRAFFFLENEIDPEVEKALAVIMHHTARRPMT